MSEDFDTDVVVIGSGFGGSVAALRFAEAGQKVVVLERGDWVSRETHQVDLDSLWDPARHRFGMNELRGRGRHLVPWIGACVGGGSHVYAGTMKRADSFEGFPSPIANDDMSVWYDRADELMCPTPFPDYPPYDGVRATQLLFDVGTKLRRTHPEVVEEAGPIDLAIAFAPKGGEPGAEFVNAHGAKQRYSDPCEQSLLGGDIDAKNTLDKNYLHLAQAKGVEIRPLAQADRIERLEGGGYRVSYARWVKEPSLLRRMLRNWFPGLANNANNANSEHSLTARRVVIAAGCVGSTELLLRNRDVHGTLPEVGAKLGHGYTTNGDFISLILPFRGLFVSWFGLIAALVGLALPLWPLVGGGVLAYFLGLVLSRRPFDPDIGTTNSDYLRFRGEDGSTQGAYIESGRYPTPVRLGIAVLLSSLGLWRPRRYRKIVRFTNILRRYVPPFALLARSWPVPLLKMGRDVAKGRFRLDDKGEAVIDFDPKENKEFYAYLDRLGRLVAKAAGAHWAPNFLYKLTKKLEIPHNQGGVPMGDNADEGVVDHAGRVFGHDDLMVLDGSVLPVSPGPNPALTILAVAERAMSVALAQLDEQEHLRAESNEPSA